MISCTAKQHNAHYITVLECIKPPKPGYEKLDNTLPLTSSKNLLILIDNTLKLKFYSKQLEQTIQCYEEQIKEVKNDNNK